jgi:hypothetical protein
MEAVIRRLLVASTTALLIAIGAAAPASARSAVRAEGDFTVAIDFPTLVLRDVSGGRCQLTVDGTLTFTGTLAGDATGTTTALVFATCAEVATTPPGTFFDLFRFSGDFIGTVGGTAVTGSLSYAGFTRPGGAIDAAIVVRGGAFGVLRADAVVAVGGTYAGVVTR